MVTSTVDPVLIVPPMLRPDFLTVLALPRQPKVDQEVRQLGANPGPPPIWMSGFPHIPANAEVSDGGGHQALESA